MGCVLAVLRSFLFGIGYVFWNSDFFPCCVRCFFRDSDDASSERRLGDDGDAAAKGWMKEADVLVEGPGVTSGVIVGYKSYFTISPRSESRY